MAFTSYGFLLFLVVLFLLYYIVPKKWQWSLLLAASYVFYFFAGWKSLVYILITTLSSYLIARKMDSMLRVSEAYIKDHKTQMEKEERKLYKETQKKRRFRWLCVALFLNFGILAVVKYADFALQSIGTIVSNFGAEAQFPVLDLLLPMGISFYTFQIMGYMIDVYRGKYPAEKNLAKLALFVSFFPQLIQGPISRFDDLAKSLYMEHRFDSKEVSFGLQRILWGFFKKLVIADRMLIAVLAIIRDTDHYRGFYVFLGMLFYALQLYADFTGGIDITIGIAQVLGIRVKENFNRPFFSKGIKEYWRRWHISLGAWFTEYLFYPISVCKPMLKLSKFSRKHFGEQIGKRIPVYLSTIAVWFVTGLWHGAAWNFIVWGLGNCFFILLSQELEPLYDKFHEKTHLQGKFGWRLFQVLRTFLLMSCLRMFDCYRDVLLTFRMFGTMFTDFNIVEAMRGGIMTLGLTVSDYVILLLGFIILLTVSLVQRGGSVREKIYQWPYAVRCTLIFGVFLSILIFGNYGIGYDASQFIYNRF